MALRYFLTSANSQWLQTRGRIERLVDQPIDPPKEVLVACKIYILWIDCVFTSGCKLSVYPCDIQPLPLRELGLFSDGFIALACSSKSYCWTKAKDPLPLRKRTCFELCEISISPTWIALQYTTEHCLPALSSFPPLCSRLTFIRRDRWVSARSTSNHCNCFSYGMRLAD